MDVSSSPSQICDCETSDESVTAILPWDQFSEWLHCVAVVTFDLELGQALEFIYPGHIELSQSERANICYLAFPDSNSGCMGDTQYCFRIRKTSPASYRKSEADHLCTKDCPVTLLKDKAHYYGYVYFRQVRDKALKRGYFQKSVVLLSTLPYFNFFKDIAEIIAPEYFDHGQSCLEAACHDIDRWPSPVPGKTLNLPLMGMLLHIRIPTKQDKPGTTLMDEDNGKSLAPYTLSSLNEVDLYESFRDVISHIQLLWELVLLGEPLVVMAPSPTSCASTVLALVSCISPLRLLLYGSSFDTFEVTNYSFVYKARLFVVKGGVVSACKNVSSRYHCDFRPYFTIHDSEFKEYTTKAKDPPNVMLGVTNPFFAKTFQHWPHIVRVGALGQGNFGSNPSLFSNDTKVKKTSKLKTLDQKSGVYTKYKPFLKKDNKFLKTFTKGLVGKSVGKEQTAIIKRHFLELTQSFVIPLERYLASLMPLQKSISPLKSPPALKPFRPHDFMEMVESSGPQLTSGAKGDWIGLYQRFLHSANFEHWLRIRRKEMKAKVFSVYLLAICDMDLSQWCRGKKEVEFVDMLLKLRKNIAMVYKHKLDLPPETVDRLNGQMKTVVDNAPDDLQAILTKQFL